MDVVPDEVEEEVEDEGFGELSADELPRLVSGFDVKVGRGWDTRGFDYHFV